jgi:hypothetical protein
MADMPELLQFDPVANELKQTPALLKVAGDRLVAHPIDRNNDRYCC